MRKNFKKISIGLLGILLVFGVATPVFAANSNDSLPTEIQPRGVISDAAWWFLTEGSQVFISNPGSQTSTNDYMEYISPSIDFNQGSIQHTVWHDLPVYADGSILLHGHRNVILPVIGKIGLGVYDSRGNTQNQLTADSNQYMFTYKQNGDGKPYGIWRCSFSVLDKARWQCYIRLVFDPNFDFNSLGEENGFYYTNNRVFQYSDSPEISTFDLNKKDAVLSMFDLNNQFIASDGTFVDYLKDYDAGDILNFKDIIKDVIYISDTNSTSFIISDGDSDHEFRFNGNLTDQYHMGDSLSLEFKIIDLAESDNHVYEGLNYEIHSDDTVFPEISDYLK